MSLFDFRGGLHLDARKRMSTQRPIRVAPVPPQLVLSLAQHAGAPAKPTVKVGERVLRGQTIARADGYVSLPLHAPTSGIVAAIEPRPGPHPSGLDEPAIAIDSDGRDETLPTPEWPACSDWRALDPATIRERVRAAGVAGLGGAAFPSFIKLNPSRTIETLILNGAECEPYISCDDVLMREQAERIVAGAQVILHAVQAHRCLIGVEDNKPDAIAALRTAVEKADDPRIAVAAVPTRYPQGASKQLLQTLTGKEIPSEGLSLDIGVVTYNVATAVAVLDAITAAQPLTSRIVTVTGHGVREPQNFEARLGTPFSFLIEQAGGYTPPPHQLIMGGPMMGVSVKADAAPVTKAVNCILVATDDDIAPPRAAMPCIRCGDCQEACPINLVPQQLYWHARGGEYAKTRALNLFDCIECGCCAQVCPSHIPLVQYYRHAKTEIWAEEREKRKADAARERFDARQARIEREEREKEEARARKKAQLAARKAASDPSKAPSPASGGRGSSDDDPVARAVAAAKAKKAAAETETSLSPPRGERAGVRGEASAAGEQRPSPPTPLPEGEGNKVADDPVARAIAAAKARGDAALAQKPEDGEA